MKNRQKLIIETINQLEEGWTVDKGDEGYQLMSTSNEFEDDLELIEYVSNKAFEDKDSIYGSAIRLLFELNPPEIEIIQSVIKLDIDEILYF